ncbi:MAG: fibrobacter succinogenes major paralogous domain-containing protein [Paludibacter sp.]
MRKIVLFLLFDLILIPLIGQSVLKQVISNNSQIEAINGSTVSDIDGNVYHTVTIGDQTWMVENLKTTHYRNGDAISCVLTDSLWEGQEVGAYCYYNNDKNNIPKYGMLYNFNAVQDTRNIAPIGYHVATREDWDELNHYLNLSGLSGTDTMVYVSKLIASKANWKESSVSYAVGNQSNDNNKTGFNAMPAGYRHNSGYYKRSEIVGEWWCFSTSKEMLVLSKTIRYDSPQFGSSLGFRMRGVSVRCVKD